MKGPTRKDDQPQSKTGKLMKCGVALSYDEAKAQSKAARKRKERQESISSLCQERKVIRSNSEERPATQKKHFDKSTNIRRVSSSEDFQKKNETNLKPNFLVNFRDNTTILGYDEDCEHEKRRSHERFSKPLTLKTQKKKSKRPKVRCMGKAKFKPEVVVMSSKDEDAAADEKKADDGNNNNNEAKFESFLQLHNENETKLQRSPSPTQSELCDFDLTTLHEQVDCCEPLLSGTHQVINEDTETLPGLAVASNRLLSSPRNSIIATHRIYLDPDIQQGRLEANSTQNPLELRLQKITKQINSLKKKIKRFEMEFETKNGYKVSHADKLNDKNVRKWYVELSKWKKDQKQLVDVTGESPKQMLENVDANVTMPNFHDTVQEIEKRLLQKRDMSHRPSILEKMSNEELLDEKVAVQKALLYLESIHGRPDNKEDRNLARPIYDRYRSLKRMISKNQTTQIGNELATIHEDETMSFISNSKAPQQPQQQDIDSEKSSVAPSTDSSDTETTPSSISENLHALTKRELIDQQRMAMEEKKQLRRTIKTFELEIQKKTGKVMVLKEDKLPIEHIYVAYKKCKAKLKLLDALVGKQL